VISDDPVIDYMVMEAVAIKATKEDHDAQEEQAKENERKQWKQARSPQLEAMR
jgi:hypothetical protein